MQTCPHCKSVLTAVEVTSGHCSQCQGRFAGGAPARSLVGGADRTLDIAPQPVDQASPVNYRAGQTLDVPSAPAPLRSKDLQATLDTPAARRPLPAQPSNVASQTPSPNTTLDEAHSVTIDQSPKTDEVDRLLNTFWDDSTAASQPQVTMRGRSTVGSGEEGNSTLVIREREFQPDEPSAARPSAADYYIIEVLGEGGMGVVFRARQASVDREVAVKMLKPDKHQDESQRRKFLSEAAVTGELDHPNIVPIYDLGQNSEGALFYSMKKVQGTPWSKVIQNKTLPENLEIFLKVADAVAFAHARGVVHRDLKPENIMLGDFGEVLVLDWGLAVATEGHRPTSNVSAAYNIAGTPAYMSPELACGPMERIGRHSDVYLLGAILYEIVTGRAPHTGKNAMACLQAAARNEIVPTEAFGELVDIALTAMATEPRDRHPNVLALQQAIRQYQSHSESIALCERAEQELKSARQSDDYQAFARAVFGFTEACAIWSGNDAAKAGISRARLRYAQSALGKNDYDLGLSLLDGDDPAHVEVRQQLLAAKRERDARQQRLKTARRVVVGLAAAIFVAVSVGSVLVTLLKFEADQQAAIARAAELEARNEKQRAEQNEQQAVAARLDADKNAKSAAEQRGLALEALGTLVSKVQEQLKETPATQQLKQDLLKSALDGLRNVAKSAQGSQKADSMMAEAWQRMGDIFQGLGQLTEARQQYQEAHTMIEALARDDADVSQWQRKLAFSFSKLGNASFLLDDHQAASKYYAEALKLRERLAAADPNSAAIKTDLATSYIMLAVISPIAEAEPLFAKALQIRKELLSSNRTARRYRDVWIVYNQLGELSLKRNDHATAREHFDQALEIAKRLAASSKSLQPKSDLALSYINAGNVRRQAGEAEEAHGHYLKAVDLLRPMAKEDPQNIDLQANFVFALARAGAHKEAVQKTEELRSLAPSNFRNLYNVACCYSLCGLAVRDGKAEGALSEQQRDLANSYANQAMDALRLALQGGFKDFELLKSDPDLAPLRARPDWQSLAPAAQ